MYAPSYGSNCELEKILWNLMSGQGDKEIVRGKTNLLCSILEEFFLELYQGYG